MPALADRLSCAHSAFPRLSLAGSLDVIRDLHFRAVDVCVFAGYEHLPPDAVVADPAAYADATLELLEGLSVSDVFVIFGTEFSTLAVNHPDPTVRAESFEAFQQVLDFALRIGSPGITVLPGVGFDGVVAERSRRLAAEELERRREVAGEAGLRLSVEPHVGSIAETPA
jgi:sugar phosphate isomerase/epimerase